jgi:hypothetical protein
MTITKHQIQIAASKIAQCNGLFANPDSILEDTVLLAYAFPAPDDFAQACANTCKAINQLVANEVSAGHLKYEFSDWKSYHYQAKVGQGQKANCRIMFREVDGGVEVKGFGHRRIPADFYARISRSGR